MNTFHIAVYTGIINDTKWRQPRAIIKNINLLRERADLASIFSFLYRSWRCIIGRQATRALSKEELNLIIKTLRSSFKYIIHNYYINYKKYKKVHGMKF